MCAPRGTARWPPPAFRPILLITSLSVATAGVADAQTIIGPGTVNGTQMVSGGAATVVGNTTISAPGGDGIDAPPFNGVGPTLTIDTERSLSAGTSGPGPISITAGGNGVASIFPTSPATININSGPSGDVTITGGNAALAVSGNAVLTASNAHGGSLTLQSAGGAGAVAQFGAQINLTGATINTSGGLASVLIGGDATDIGAIGNLTNVNIVANGSLIGLDATRMGTVATMTGGSITVTGNGIAGLYSDTDGVTNTTNVNILTTGANTYGAFAEATIPGPGSPVSPGGGTLNITGGSITTQGAGAFGIFAQGQPSVPSTITLNGSTITTGNPASAVAGASAAAYRTDGGTINATNTIAQTYGPAAPGGILSNGGTLTINGGSVTTRGPGSFGFLVQPFTPALQSAAEPGLTLMPLAVEPTLRNLLQISNATVNSAADAFNVNGATANITVNGSSVSSNNGVLLNTLSSGATTLTAGNNASSTTSSNAHLTGAITTDATSTANVTLLNNTTWTMTGSSNLTNLVNDPSTIVFTPPSGDPTQLASYKTLTTVNYTGVGGTIVLNTFLGTDGSPSDQLIINGGAAIGSTGLIINNTNGPGAHTFGNGIQVVQAINSGTTAPGAFQLTDAVVAGPFEYLLFQGGLNGSNPENWYLRNDFIVPPIDGGGTPPIGGFPPDPPPEPLPPGVYPIIGPRLSAYGVVQPIARQLGLTQLGTLHERIGDTLAVGNGGDDADGWARSAWGRVIGQQIDNRYQAFADPRANGQILGMQAGIDLLRASFQPGHRDVGGLYFSYLNGNADVDGLVTNLAASTYVLQHTGTVNLNAYSVGGYWTHYGPGDWYLDAVLQGTRYGGNTTATFAPFGLGFQSNLSTSGSGFVGSLEGGYPIPLPQLWPNFILEPQAQLIWQHTDFDQANDGLSTVGLGSTSGTTGRLGVRAQWTIPGDNGAVWQPYGRFNVWRDWGGAADTLFSGSGIGVPLLDHATRLEFAGGLTYKLQTNLSFYAQAGYEFAIAPDNVQRDGVKGDVGLRYTW